MFILEFTWKNLKFLAGNLFITYEIIRVNVIADRRALMLGRSFRKAFVVRNSSKLFTQFLTIAFGVLKWKDKVMS